MNQKEKLEEVTIRALTGNLNNIHVSKKLTEATKSETEIKRDINITLNNAWESCSFGDNGHRINIKNNILNIYFISDMDSEDITREDVNDFLKEIIPDIKTTLQSNPNSVTEINITVTDDMESKKYSRKYKVTPPKSENVIQTSSGLSKKLVKNIAEYIVDYMDATDVVGGSEGSIYSWIAEQFDPNYEYYNNDLETFKEEYGIDISNINFKDKNLIKPIALQVITLVCHEEDWSISEAKRECEY